MSSLSEILNLFVKLVIDGNDFTEAGINKAFEKFDNSLKIHEHKPKINTQFNGDYVKTTLKQTAEAAKQPVFITADKNKYGNIESTIYPGLIFIEESPSKWIAHGLQDGANIAPLTMNVALVCQANGWRYDGNNLTGSAKATTSPLRVDKK